jgi:hypothetical protein
LERQAVQERVRQTSGALIGTPGVKVQLAVEIMKSNYSQQWNTWYATALPQTTLLCFLHTAKNWLKVQSTLS